MTRNIFIWLILTSIICYQDCRAFSPSRADSTSLNNNKPTNLFRYIDKDRKDKKETKASRKDNPEPVNYNDIIENLRSSWQMPGIYLEKRGYLNKVPKSLISRIQEETNPLPNEAVMPEKFKTCCSNCPCTGTGCKPCRISKKKSRGIHHKNAKKDLEINIDGNAGGSGQTTAAPTPNDTVPLTTSSPGFFQKVKNVFSKLQKSPTKTDSIKKFFEFKYDDSWLREPQEEESAYYGPHYPTLYKKNIGTREWVPTVCDGKNCKTTHQRQAFDHNIFTKDLNYEEIFKNLTKTDVDYVKNFLRCFKENKNKFMIEYLHVNTTPPATEYKKPGADTKSTTTEKYGKTMATPTTTSKPGSSGTVAKNTTSLASNTTMAKNNKMNDTQNVSISTEVESPSNKSGNGGINASKANTTATSGEDIKINLNIPSNESGEVVLGDGGSKNCTPIRLNGISFDLEVGNPSSSPPAGINPIIMSSFDEPLARSADSDWIENEVASQYLSDQVDGDSHGQDLDKRNGFLTKLTKKREVAYPEDEVLSDISSSLHKASVSNRAALNFDEYNDYNADEDIDSPEKSEDVNYDHSEDQDADNEAELFGRRKKKKKKKKKNKKKLRLRNDSNSIKLDASNLDRTNEINEDDRNDERMLSKEKNDDELPFSELKDIKFRVNPEQEEAIQKFIESLDSPPEIFNFDVEKYIKQPESKINEELHIEAAPPRTFYEFLETPSLEKEQVPLIQSDTEKGIRSSNYKQIDRAQNKRDLLRQYIKGVANRLHEIDSPLYELEEEGAKEQEKREEEANKEDRILSDSLAGRYDSLDYSKFKPESKLNKAEQADDFVDKFYLLNDGTVQVYEPKHLPRVKYDPANLEIDLDLDKKFRDLTLTRNAHAHFQDQEEIEASEKKPANEINVEQESGIMPEDVNSANVNDGGVSGNEIETFYDDQSISDKKRRIEPVDHPDTAQDY